MPGCATVLPIPFVLGGLLALAFAFPEAAGDRWTTAAIFGLLGVVFASIGAAMHFTFRKQASRQKRLAARQAEWPEEPWRWREDWADGPITDTMRQQMIASWFVAILWNAIALPSTVLGIREALRTGEMALWLVTIFGAAGIGLLVSAILQTMRYRRYGVSALELETFPGFLGGTLAGRIRASTDLRDLPRIPIVLRCLRLQVTGTGKQRSARETVLFEDQIDVVRTYREGHSTLVHFAFRLPADAQPSTALPAADQIVWRLEAHAEAPGVDYHASFEVPVFAPPPGAVLPSQDLPIAVGFDDYTQPPSSRILVTTTRRGTEVWLPAARHVVPALVVTASAVFFGGVGIVLLWSEAPRLLAWVVALGGGVLGMAAANLWFGTSRILASPGGLELTTGFLGIGHTRTIPAAEVADIRPQSGMQANARYYSDLALHLTGGRRIVLGRAIREKREAEWLADRLLRGLGR
jgi:hypothetical protein